MIDCLPQTRLPRHRISRGLDVAGCHVDLAIDVAVDHIGISAAAARLAEDLVAVRIGCERRLVRVAALSPSGRPVATVQGRGATVSVSVSHADGLFGAAVCGTASVGLDIVDPAEAGPALDAWFTPDELTLFPDGDGLLRARLWTAKEAAFKAAGLDDGFRPRGVAIGQFDTAGYRWTVRSRYHHVCGRGVFMKLGTHLVAIAVAAAATPLDRPDREPLS